MQSSLESSWNKALHDEWDKPYFTELVDTLETLYRDSAPIYPPQSLLFTAFDLCPLDAVKVVILGQDPYHGEGQAHGLSFSVQDSVKIPPSLQNIFKEVKTDIGTPIPPHGNLRRWAEQGVLLLNTTLTVEKGKHGSHKGLGWEDFTDAVITTLSLKREHIVFLLWGKHAETKEVLIDSTRHFILKAPHPSPFSAHTGFFGCKHFSQTNEYLIQHHREPIVW